MKLGPQTGKHMRLVRKKHGLSILDVAHRSRIPPKILTALESGNSSAFPSACYLKSFLRQYANFLGVDVEDELETIDTSFAIRPDDPLLQTIAHSAPAGNATPTPTRTQHAQTSTALQPLVVFLITGFFILGTGWTFHYLNQQWTGDEPYQHPPTPAPSTRDPAPSPSVALSELPGDATSY